MFDIPSLIDAHQQPAIATDIDGGILSINELAAQILELEHPGSVNRKVTDILPATREIFESGQNQSLVIQKIDSRYLEIRSFQLINEDRIYYWLILDLKEEHHLEAEKLKERYQIAVEAGHTGIWDYSFDDNRLIVDESLKNLLGYKADEMIDNVFFWDKLVAEEDRKELKQAIETNVRKGKTYFEETFRMAHRHRVLLWVLGRGKIIYEKGAPYRIICSVTDITDRKEASEQLRRTLINFKAIFDAFPDLFFRVDRLGDFLEIMAGESSDFGIPGITGYEGKNIRDAFPESEYLKLYECLRKTFESRGVEKCDYVLKVNSRKRYYEARMISISGDEAIGIVRDISDSVKINRALIRAKKTAEEALNARDSFFSMMSHEMRSPLNVVIGMIYLLLEQDPVPEQLKLIRTMKFSADNLLSLINDLLDFSKIKAGKIVFEHTEFDLPEIIRNIYNSYQLQMDGTAVKVTLDMPEEIPQTVSGDAKRLSQILNNLLGNAQKFTASGEISIIVRKKRVAANNVWIEFRIKDTGIGIAENRLKEIFKPFEQGEPGTSHKYGGTGLGLTIVKQLVELQGGTLSVRSSPGTGSVFSLTLPFRTHEPGREPEPANKNSGERPMQIHSLRILYADDVSSNLLLMKGYADLWKFHLEIANNGAQALDFFRKKKYDIVLLDLQMPGKNGIEIAREMREFESVSGDRTPIIAVTGDVADSSIRQIEAAGMDDFLSKPVNPRTMLETIGRWHPVHLEAEKTDETEPRPSPQVTGYPEEEVIDFRLVDTLYEDAPGQYREYVSQLMRELKENLSSLRSALKEENYDEFRRVRHSMKSNLKLLSMNQLQVILDEIRDQFRESRLPPAGGGYYERVEEMIEKLLYILDSKRAVITDQD